MPNPILNTSNVFVLGKNVAVYWFLIGGILGLLWGCDAQIYWLLGLLFLPVGYGLAPSRWTASCLMFGYFLIGSRGLPQSANVFFGDGVSWWTGFALWLLISIALTLPFLTLWVVNPLKRSCFFLLALCISIVPPLGLIGYINPLSVAGLLFPELGWLGLMFTMVLMIALASRNKRYLIPLFILALGMNLSVLMKPVPAPLNWQGNDTHFSKLGSGEDSDDSIVFMATRVRVKWLNTFMDSIPANSVRVLPETILGKYDLLNEWMLESAAKRLTARNSRILIGAEIYVTDQLYKNSVVVLGAKTDENKYVTQSIPVPISMWKPWTPDKGAVAHILSTDSVIQVQGKHIGVLICYEQYLIFSMLKTMARKPDMLVGVANLWWIKGRSLANIQQQMMQIFGRLMGVPIVTARNL